MNPRITSALSVLLGVLLFLNGCFGQSRNTEAGHLEQAFKDSQLATLAKAGQDGDIKAIDVLLAAGVPINGKGELGVTPAWWAMRTRSKKGLGYLLENGAKPDPDVEALSLLELAAADEDPEFLRMLVRYKPNLNQVGRVSGETPLIKAITHVRPENLRQLINAGVDLNFSGSTTPPLMIAAQLGRYDFVYEMINAGADPTKAAKSGATLARTIGNRIIDPDSDAYEWREKVRSLLRRQGIETQLPSRERKKDN